MKRDRSLDEFAGGASGSSKSTGADAEAAGEDANNDRESADEEANSDAAEDVERTGNADPTEDVEPAVATYRWEPDGTACPDCGRVADRLWSRDGELVCGDCKVW